MICADAEWREKTAQNISGTDKAWQTASETFDFSGKIYYNENTDAYIRYLILKKANCSQGIRIRKGMEEPGVTVDYGGIYE